MCFKFIKIKCRFYYGKKHCFVKNFFVDNLHEIALSEIIPTNFVQIWGRVFFSGKEMFWVGEGGAVQ